MRFLRVLLAVGAGLAMLAAAPVRKEIAQMLQEALQGQGSPPTVLAAYMPWFGDKSHIDVGYSSHDRAVLRRQIDQAVSMGISGFAVDWKGSRRPYTDKTFALMEQAADEKNFKVALLYNEDADAAKSTEEAIAEMNRAYDSYIGPEADHHEAYLTYNGRPVIFIFPNGGHSDWNRLRESVNQWQTPPLLFYKDGAPAQYANAFDGFYSWVHAGPKGWQANGSDWGKEYLENFYKRMKEKYPNKLMVAGVWSGFDDSRASWGQNRHMDARCGKTFEDTLRMALHQDRTNVIPFLLIETWNDYEEGSAIEQLSFQNCE